MTRKIVVDSSADLTALPQACFSAVPLTIHAGNDAYRDDEALDVAGMIASLRARKGRVTTSCPAPADWQAAFEDADEVFCVTITGALSAAATPRRSRRRTTGRFTRIGGCLWWTRCPPARRSR